MKMRSRSFMLLATSALLALSGCSTPTGEPTEPSTVQLQADYRSYDERSLIQEATLVAEGTVLATESKVLAPRAEGDNPQENPLLGLSEEEKKKAIEQDDGVAGTVVTFRIDVVHKGAVKPGQESIIIQTGGVINGVTYRVEGEPLLAVGESYLLFARDGFDGAFAILGGSAGTYRSSGDGIFTAVNPDTAPFQELSSEEVESLTH